MTRLQQFQHIMKKDIHQRWPEIVGMMALTALLTISSIESWTQAGSRYLPGDYGELIAFLVPVTWCVLIARVIHGESLPGREQLWLTRPYDRLSLVLAKLAFVALFVHLPLIAAQTFILKASLLPFTVGALLSGQAVLAALVTLPAMAIASLTRSLGQFIAVAVGVVAAVLVLFLFNLEVMRDMFASARDARLESSWTAAFLMYLFVAVCAATACAWQYRTRRTRVVTTALGSVALFGLLMLYIDAPRNLARAVELRLYSDETGTPVYAFGQPEVVRNDSQASISLRFPLTGMSDDLDSTVLHDWRVSLISKSGEFIERRSLSHGYPIAIYLSPDSVAQFGDSALRVRIDYIVETFDDVARHRIRMSPDPETGYELVSLIDSGLQCRFIFMLGFLQQGTLTFPSCRSAFASPKDWHLELVRTVDGPIAVFTQERTSQPFAINPIVRGGIEWHAEDEMIEELRSLDTLPIIVRKRATLERRHAEFDDIVLTELIDGG